MLGATSPTSHQLTIRYRGNTPEILIGVLFYGYMTGIFSSRKVEGAIYESLALRQISANQHPDHDTIADFRAKYLKE